MHLLTAARPQDVPRSGWSPPGVPAVLWDTLLALTEPDPGLRLSVADAATRLSAAELAWHDGAAGDVEVFDHLAPAASSATVTDLEPTVQRTPAPATPGPRPAQSRARDVAIFGVFGALILIGLVLIFL